MKLYEEILALGEAHTVSRNEVRIMLPLENVLRVVAGLKGTTFEHELAEFDRFYKTLGRPQAELVWVEEFAQYEEVK